MPTNINAARRRPTESGPVNAEPRFRALVDALPHLVWTVRASDGALTYANHRFRAYFGDLYSTRDDCLTVCHPDDRDQVEQIWQRAEAQGTEVETEARWLRADGAFVWHRVILSPVRQDGTIVEWLCTGHDIDDLLIANGMIREEAELLDVAQEAAGAGLFAWDLTKKCGRLSPRSLRLLGLPADHGTSIGGQEWASLIHPDDLRAMSKETDRAVATGTSFRTEFRLPRPDGSDTWILGVGRVVVDAAGRPVRIVGLNIDMTERKRTEDLLRQSQERLAFALDSGSDALWDWTVPTGATWYSDRWFTMLGYDPGELALHASTWERLIHPDDRDRAVAITTAHLMGRTPGYECEHRLRRKDGGWGWVLSRGKVVTRDAQGNSIRIVGTHIDINARKAAESQIAHMARHDALTDLPNRTLFRERLDQRLAEIARYGGSCAVLCLDLDRFKTVNDTLGHLVGDALLREIAHRLRTVVRVEDTVARLGGDEFIVLASTVARPEAVADLAERLVAAVGVPMAFGDQQAEVGLSVGIALAPEHGIDGESVLKRADLALYRAKANGRNTARFYDAAMDEEAAHQRELERDLRRAVAQGELVLHYQPQVKGTTGELVGFEALVRWQHPIHGLVPPVRFIPLAESVGLIGDLGEWVLRTACREAAGWSTPLRVAVNVSPRQFQQIDLPDLVLAILLETGLSPGRLELEITESVIINDMARALNILRRLKDLGVRIAMDDFGTGYSSLATLNAFPFDKLKIDRTFVGQIGDSPQAAAIVRAVLGLGRSLGIGVVAEGVETETQSQFLMDEACGELQGYLYGKPRSIEHFADAVHATSAIQGPAPTVASVAPRKRRLPASAAGGSALKKA